MVNVGIVAPLSGSTALYGQDPSRILLIYEQLLAKQLTRFKYQFRFEDGRCGEGHAAATAAQKLINLDKVRFLVLGCSGEVLQVAPIAEKNKVVAIGYAASHPDIKALGDYIFRTYVDIEQGVSLVIRHMKQSGTKRLAILTEANAFTAGIRKLLEAQAPDLIQFDDEFKADESDFRTLILKAKATNSDAWYLNVANPKSYQNLVRQVKQLDVKATIYSYHQPLDPSSLQTLGDLQEGVIVLAVPEARGSSVQFEKVFNTFLESEPDGPAIEILARSSFDAMQALVVAIEKVGPDASKVKDFLYSYKGEGALGEVAFDANGDIRGLQMMLKTIKGKKGVNLVP